jgi:hypothetical protein
MAPEPMENEEGGSLKKKVATGVAVGLATTAAAGVAKKMLDSNDDEGEGSSQDRSRSTRASSGGTRSATARQSGGSRSRSGSTRSSSSARSKAKSGNRGANRTKEQLYRQAKRLGVEGRSKMSKAQLERAVARAK